VPDGVLLMAYGTPASMGDVERYYTHIRRGRPPEPARLAELIGRYEAIGGSSPLLKISRAQASGLQAQLEQRSAKSVRVELGMKHAPPFIEDGVRALIDAGVGHAIGLVLAPHYSELSVGEYRERAQRAGGDDLELEIVEQWHLAPAYVELLAGRVRQSLASFPEHARKQIDVVFTAHSLPARILGSGDPYPAQLRETAEAVAHRAGAAHWSIAWQSAGRTSDEWIGPDILQVVRELAAAGSAGVVVCPAGFVSDHLEILYDLDVECRAVAQEVGLPYTRTESPNADPAFLSALADVVLARKEAVTAR
jgi:ferrochelatase